MDHFVARQPILDARQQVFAYELLFRGGPENFFPQVDGTHASSRVIHDSLHVFGLDTLASNKRLFINVTRDVLLRDVIRVLPPKLTTVEILETVEPDEQVVQACKQLKQAGYALALDDFVFRPDYKPLVALADVIKIDFLQTKSPTRQNLVKQFARSNLRFLAEKVETHAEYVDASKAGYTLFQGYFFCRPEMLTAKAIPAFKVNYVRLLHAANDRKFDFGKIEEIVKQDVALSVKLLRYLNSAMFGWRYKVTTIKHALVLLGERNFRKWVSLIALVGLGNDRPHELVVTSLVRARFCEQLTPKLNLGERELDCFLVGMLSAMDALVGRPMPEVLEGLGMNDDVHKALVAQTGPLAPILKLAMAYERGDWESVASLSTELRVQEGVIPPIYNDAVDWSNKIFTTRALG